MKTNEYYRHKWNKYVSKVTNVKRDKVELTVVNSGVAEVIAKNDFELNYESVLTIYQWRKTIEALYPFAEILFVGDTIQINVEDSRIDFRLTNNLSNQRLIARFTDDLKEAMDLYTNTLEFLVEDAEEAIKLFAELFEDDEE